MAANTCPAWLLTIVLLVAGQGTFTPSRVCVNFLLRNTRFYRATNNTVECVPLLSASVLATFWSPVKSCATILRLYAALIVLYIPLQSESKCAASNEPPPFHFHPINCQTPGAPDRCPCCSPTTLHLTSERHEPRALRGAQFRQRSVALYYYYWVLLYCGHLRLSCRDLLSCPESPRGTFFLDALVPSHSRIISSFSSFRRDFSMAATRELRLVAKMFPAFWQEVVCAAANLTVRIKVIERCHSLDHRST